MKKGKKTHRVYAFFVLLFAVLIVLLSLFLIFHIQKVNVKGNEYCSSEEITKSVQNDRYSVNSLYVLGKYALGKGEKLTALESVKVSISNPWTLNITVKEKKIIGCVKNEETYYFFDQEGMVVLTGTEPMAGIPVVEGIEADSLALYTKMKKESSKIYEEILEASQEMQKYELAVDKIMCRGDRIYVYIGKICVSLGSDVTSQKAAQIPNIIEKLDGKEGTLHLENFADGNGTITFDIGQFPEEN